MPGVGTHYARSPSLTAPGGGVREEL
jgi:hypothetical protein